MAQRFNGSVVWITGGGTGIGLAMAEAFGAEGASVAISGRRQDRLDAAVAKLEAAGVTAMAAACDVTDEASVIDAVASVVERFGKLDVCVANAGFSVAGKLRKLKIEDWRRQFDVNVVGLAATAKHALPHLEKTKGRLVLIGSVASFVPAPGLGAYNASKAAVRSIGTTLSAELHGSGVTCTTIHPGFVESEIAKVDNRGRFDEGREDRRPMKLMWPADKAAKVCLDAIHARKREFVFTGHGKVGAFMGRHFPGLTYMAVRGK